MKNKLSLLALMISATIFAQAQTARLQVIHNSADAAAAQVDVWVKIGANNAVKLLDDFGFREATAFIDVNAGVNINIGIAPGNSTMYSDTIISFDATFMANETYVAIANGIVSSTGYSPATPFNLYVSALGREQASTTGNTDVLVFHGATDAPTVDVVEVGVGAGTIVDDLEYGMFSTDYLELPTADYALQIRDEYGETTVAEYDAVLNTLGLKDSAIVVLASGFLDPTMNSSGPAFGLYVALPSGGNLIQVPSKSISTARVQAIHNSADAAAEVVDVWLDNTLLLDDFEFRTASPFVDAPAGTDIELRIQPATSTDTNNPIAMFKYNLMGGEKYMLIANGIVSSTGYDPVQGFDIYVQAGARERSTDENNTDVIVFHGSTDAPTVDVYESSVPAGTIVDNLEYGKFSNGYLELATADYILDIQDETGVTTVARFEAPLATLMAEGAAISVVASGFLDPSVNSDGPAFGLYAALAAGGDLVELPAVTTTGIDEEVETSFSLYPNPATNLINIEGNDLEGSILRIYNTQGQIKRTVQVTNNRMAVDVSGFETGMYMILSEDNKSTFFMVQ